MTDNQVDRDAIVRHHLDTVEGWVTEAAVDLQVDPGVAFWDVAMSYLEAECPHEYRAAVCKGLGLDPGPEVWARWDAGR